MELFPDGIQFAELLLPCRIPLLHETPFLEASDDLKRLPNPISHFPSTPYRYRPKDRLESDRDTRSVSMALNP